MSFKGVRLSGILGWLVWLLVHITFLTGFRNRLTAAFHWTGTFVVGGRAERTITLRQVTGRVAIDEANKGLVHPPGHCSRRRDGSVLSDAWTVWPSPSTRCRGRGPRWPSRWRFHIILVPLGVSWALMALIANYRGLRHGDPTRCSWPSAGRSTWPSRSRSAR